MKKIFRSILWMDQAEKNTATENLKQTRPERLANLRTAERALLDLATDFYAKHAEAPQLQTALDHFTNLNDPDALSILEEAAKEQQYTGGSYTDLFEREVEEQAAQLLTATCKTAIKIAVQGHQIGKQTLRGTDEAAVFLLSSVRGKPPTGEGKMPAGMLQSSTALSDLYKKRKNSPQQTYGVPTGYGLFDAATAGIRKKQLYLHAGFGGHLKTTHMLNMMVNAATDGGWNPILFTSEMPAEDVKLLLVAIHSGNPKFAQQGRPLNAYRLLLGALKPPEEAFFELAKEDLTTNKNHGSIRVVDSSEFSSWATVCQRATREHAEEEVDILWVDYLTRLPLDTKYRGVDTTTARNETIVDAKRFAMEFNRGEGLAVCSPFQVNREGFKAAKANEGKLGKTALAQYNAAEREADIISYIFFDSEEQATSEPKIGMLKARWGKLPPDPVAVYIDPDCRRIYDLSAGMATPTTAAPTSGTRKAEEDVTL